MRERLLHQPPWFPSPSPTLSLTLRIFIGIQTPGDPWAREGQEGGEDPRTPIKGASECQRVDLAMGYISENDQVNKST